MPDYTFGAAAVLLEGGGGLAIGATGVLRPPGGGNPVQLYDLNGSPIIALTVGPFGAHQEFKADIPHGVLDFGSTQMVAVSIEALTAAINVQGDLEALRAQVEAVQSTGSGYNLRWQGAGEQTLTFPVEVASNSSVIGTLRVAGSQLNNQALRAFYSGQVFLSAKENSTNDAWSLFQTPVGTPSGFSSTPVLTVAGTGPERLVTVKFTPSSSDVAGGSCALLLSTSSEDLSLTPVNPGDGGGGGVMQGFGNNYGATFGG